MEQEFSFCCIYGLFNDAACASNHIGQLMADVTNQMASV